MRRLITAAVISGAFLCLAITERKRPLRRRVEDAGPRTARNLTLGALSLAAAQLVEPRLVSPRREKHGVVRVIASIVLLDYTLWWWHRLNHQLPPLWRFHEVHHADRDLDASTAFRFHFGEHALSFVYRALQVAVIRPNEFSLWLWQLLLFVSILFHHSNVDLEAADDALSRFVVTPRMHGIHHSDRPELMNKNFSSILTCWDALHGTLRTDVPQEDIVIGVNANDVRLATMIAAPFV